jgi:hypothetical protein
MYIVKFFLKMYVTIGYDILLKPVQNMKPKTESQ